MDRARLRGIERQQRLPGRTAVISSIVHGSLHAGWSECTNDALRGQQNAPLQRVRARQIAGSHGVINLDGQLRQKAREGQNAPGRAGHERWVRVC